MRQFYRQRHVHHIGYESYQVPEGHKLIVSKAGTKDGVPYFIGTLYPVAAKQCKCDVKLLLANGCKCGGI